MRVFSAGLVVLALGAPLLPGCRKTDNPGHGRIAREETRAVVLVPAQMRPMTRTVTATGTLASQEKSVLSAKVSGHLQHLPVDIGSVVRQGDLLAQIEPRDYELGLQQAAAALAQARTVLGLPPEGEDDAIELEEVSAVRQAQAVLDEATNSRERIKNLLKSGIASDSEMDTAEATYKVALSRYQTALEEARTRIATAVQRRAECELAQKQLADTAIRAPFAGAVQARLANVGEYLAPGTPIVELVTTDPLRLRLQVPERESSLVRMGQVVHVFTETDTNAHPGRIARLSPALDEQTRMLLVEADVPAREPLRPGLFARGRIIVDEAQPGLSIPACALMTFAGIEKVVVVNGGKALEKVVTTGRRGSDWIEILSGLAEGEQVVLEPSGLRTGQPVTVTVTSSQRVSSIPGPIGPVQVATYAGDRKPLRHVGAPSPQPGR